MCQAQNEEEAIRRRVHIKGRELEEEEKKGEGGRGEEE